MAERRSLNEEKLKQCFAFFERETAHWNRMRNKRVIISLEEYSAKEAIIEAVHRVAAVAAEVLNLNWNYGELRLAMNQYRTATDL